MSHVKVSRYRGMQIRVSANRNSGHWSGLTKGGAVLLTGNHPTRLAAEAALREQIDLFLGRTAR